MCMRECVYVYVSACVYVSVSVCALNGEHTSISTYINIHLQLTICNDIYIYIVFSIIYIIYLFEYIHIYTYT